MTTTPIVHLIHRAGQRADAAFLAEARGNRVTPAQSAVLVALDGTDGLSQTQLTARTGIDRSTMADIVRRLLKRKLVTRRRNHVDKRAYVVVLSGAGEDLVAELREATERTDEALLASVPAKYRAALVESLRLISATPSAEAAE